MPSLVKRPAALNGSNGHVRVDGRRERLAVNIADARRDGTAEIAFAMLAGRVDASAPVRVDPDRIDEVGVVLAGDLLTAACVVDSIREADRHSARPPLRVYLSRGGNAWTKVGGSASLTVLVAGLVALDPAVFPPVVAPSDLVGRVAERVVF